jgi:arylsulfatase
VKPAHPYHARFGGCSLFVKDGNLIYVYNFLGIPPS